MQVARALVGLERLYQLELNGWQASFPPEGLVLHRQFRTAHLHLDGTVALENIRDTEQGIVRPPTTLDRHWDQLAETLEIDLEALQFDSTTARWRSLD